MKLAKENLGKVSVTVEKAYHSVNKEYDKLVVVEEEGQFRTFISRKPVPIGIELTDREFWLPFSSVKESIVIDYNKFKQYIRTGEGLLDDSILTRHIKNRNVTGDKIAEATITFVNIADEGVTLPKINKEAIDTTLTKEGHLAEAKHTGDRLLNIEGLSVIKVPSTQSTVLDAWQIIDKKGNIHGVTINTYKDKSIDAIWLSVHENDLQPEDPEVKVDNPRYLNIVYNKADGTQQKVSIPLASFVTEAEFSKNGFKVIDGVVNLKISSDITTSRYFHFDSDGNITLDGFEERILEDLGTLEHSQPGDGTMWGEFKKQEEIREQVSNSAHQVFSDNWDEEDDDPEDYDPLAVTEASYAYNWKTTDTSADDGKSEGNLKDLYQSTVDLDKKVTELKKKVGGIINYTDAIPANGEYINRSFHLEEGKDVGLSINAEAISQEGTIIVFYIYKSDGSRVAKRVLNNQYYDSIRALFNNYAGEITGYAYYITTFNVGDVITSFIYYSFDKEIENVKKDIDNAQREISNTANNLAYTQALAGGETHIYVDVKQGINLNPETKYSFPIKSGIKITLSANLYDVVSGAVYVYLWYSDGTESSAYSIGSKISIDKDVEYIGLYIPSDYIIKDGSIMVAAIFENTTLNSAIEYVNSKDKVFKLVGIGADSTIYNNWHIGDLYFDTKTNKIYECVSINPLNTEPTELLQKGLLYICNNVVYTFDGLSLTKYHDKDVIDGVLVDYPQFLVGENINNDSTGGDKSTYIYKDLIKFDVDADEEIEISCSKIIDSKSSAPIVVYGYDATSHETEIKALSSGINIIIPSLSYKSIKVCLYPTTSGMSVEYCTFNNIRIRKYKRTDIPAYYIKDNYIKNKIDVIRQKMVDANGNFDAFAFITDLHWLRNAKNSPAIINYLQDRVQLPRVFMGGDYADGINMDYIKAFNEFRGKIYRAIGNHEYMNYWEEDGVFSQKDITDANIWAIYQSGMTDIVIGDANTNYYYVDNVVQKMRYIILSVFTDGSAGKFEQAQATWLNDSLANMPNGYTAIVIAHYYAYINYPDFTPVLTTIGKQIADICDTHVGKVACMLQGHTHEDLMMKTDGGIPIFATTCDKSTADFDETNEEAHYIYDKRINGTITEQAFDIVIINKTDKKVSLVRIGAPADNDGVDFYEVREQTYL